jgi:hypothetical protein
MLPVRMCIRMYAVRLLLYCNSLSLNLASVFYVCTYVTIRLLLAAISFEKSGIVHMLSCIYVQMRTCACLCMCIFIHMLTCVYTCVHVLGEVNVSLLVFVLFNFGANLCLSVSCPKRGKMTRLSGCARARLRACVQV